MPRCVARHGGGTAPQLSEPGGGCVRRKSLIFRGLMVRDQEVGGSNHSPRPLQRQPSPQHCPCPPNLNPARREAPPGARGGRVVLIPFQRRKRMKHLVILIASVLPLAAAIDGTVRIDSGDISGIPTSTPGIYVFRGIPYAAPPVGNLRWQSAAAGRQVGRRAQDGPVPGALRAAAAHQSRRRPRAARTASTSTCGLPRNPPPTSSR